MTTYESDLLRDWYLLFHYGTPDQILDGAGFDPTGLPTGCLEFPVATVETAAMRAEVSRALDVGCAVGRSAFEMSKFSREVVGIDFSANFVEAAKEIGAGEAIRCRRYAEMHLPEEIEVTLPPGSDCGRVRFEQGDAMNLRPDLGTFDLVHAANLLCRLPEPQRFLDRLSQLVNPGGTLVLATPATWLEEYTPIENRPSGLTLDFLRERLEGSFDLREVREIPFLIREHRRKFQLSTSQASTWVRK